MKVAVTGGAGYVGIELVYALCAHPTVESVVLIDNMSRAHFNVFSGKRKFLGVQPQLAEMDVLNTNALAPLLDPCDFIFHCAAATPNNQLFHTAHSFSQTNNYGTASVVEAVMRSDTKKTLVNLSTLWAMRDFRDGPAQPFDLSKYYYGISKEKGEKQLAVLSTSREHRYINVRCPNVFGYSKNLRLDSIINQMVFSATAYNYLSIESEIRTPVPYIYISALITLLLDLLSDDEEDSRLIIPQPLNIDHFDVLKYLELKIPHLQFTLVDQAEYDLNTSKFESSLPNLTEIAPIQDYSHYIDQIIESLTIKRT